MFINILFHTLMEKCIIILFNFMAERKVRSNLSLYSRQQWLMVCLLLDRAAEAAISQFQPLFIQLSCLAHCKGLLQGAACSRSSFSHCKGLSTLCLRLHIVVKTTEQEIYTKKKARALMTPGIDFRFIYCE